MTFQELIDSPDIRTIDCENLRTEIRMQLADCREERRPYLFRTPTMRPITQLNRILVPVTMLEEEVYKAELCTYLARNTGATLLFLMPHDVGSKARHNLDKILTHVRAISERTGVCISYEVLEGRKDSFSLAREATERQSDFGHQLLILTASREYGLDDILFGPPELRAIRHSLVPVMLLNPRADLFSLCD